MSYPGPCSWDGTPPNFPALMMQAALEERVWAAEEDPEEGTSQSTGGANVAASEPHPERAWLQDPHFCRVREGNPSLQWIQHSVAVINRQVKDAHRAGHLP